MNEDNLSLDKLDKMCRTCLNNTNSETLASVFNVHYNENTLIDILSLCTGLQIDENNQMPWQICAKCIAETIRCYDFRILCERSDARLKRILETANKQELPEEDDSRIDSSLKDEEEASESSNVSFIETKRMALKQRRRERMKKKSVKARRGPTYVCCCQTFDTRAAYARHRKEKKHPRPRNRECIYCKKSFTYSHLKQHLRIHTREKPFKCEICQQRFSLNCNLRRHMMTHTGERPHKCKVCGKGFIQATSLTEHMRIHNGEIPFVCNYCGKSFKQSATLKSHLRLHQNEDMEEDEKSPVRKHQCPTCLNFYTTKTVLKTHMLTHGEKGFLCSHCGKVFARRAGLQSHSKVHTGAKPYTCTVCNKRFSQLGSLKSHLLIHFGEKPFVCSDCGRAFTQKNHLKYHQRTHSGEKPYECSVCGKRFAINGTLTVHMRTHTGETPFPCSMCDKAFYDSSSLRKHEKGTHGVVETTISEETVVEGNQTVSH